MILGDFERMTDTQTHRRGGNLGEEDPEEMKAARTTCDLTEYSDSSQCPLWKLKKSASEAKRAEKHHPRTPTGSLKLSAPLCVCVCVCDV